MRRNLRALALAAVGGLLLLAPVSTAFATSDVYMPRLPPGGSQATPWLEFVRAGYIDRMTAHDAGDEHLVPGPKPPQGPFDHGTQTVDGGRHDGKTVPG